MAIVGEKGEMFVFYVIICCLGAGKLGVHAKAVSQCAGSSPVYLLDHAIPDLYRLPRGVSIRYEEANSLHAFHLGPHAGALRVRAPQVLTKCVYFPEEFSILATIRMNSDAPLWAEEYIFAVIPDASVDILLGLRISRRKITLNYRGIANPGKRDSKDAHSKKEAAKPEDSENANASEHVDKKTSLVTDTHVDTGTPFPNIRKLVEKRAGNNFIEAESMNKNNHIRKWRPYATWRKNLYDGQWHTLVVTVAAGGVTLRIDCGVAEARTIQRTFPSFLDASETSIHIGNRKVGTGQFTGLMKQLLILPGGDASVLTCPAPQPNLPAIAWKPDHNFEADAPSPSIQSDASCTWSDTGKMRYDIYRQELLVCLMGVWQSSQDTQGTALKPPRLDYIQESSPLPAASPSIDMEVFTAPGLGTLLATASHDGSKSGKQTSAVYRWDNGTFRNYQNLPTDVAQSVKHFAIKNKLFLAVANMGTGNSSTSRVHIYRYSKSSKLFRLYQEIPAHTARSIDFAFIDGHHYLAIANHREGSKVLTDSYILRWDHSSRKFVHFQSVLSQGALDVTFMQTEDGRFQGLAFANGFSGNSTRTMSHIYVWTGKNFEFLQEIETYSACDVEFFKIGEDYFMAIANALNYTKNVDNPDQFQLKSPIYRLSKSKKPRFELFQLIDTFSIFDWEFFTVGADSYLIASNLQHRLPSTTGHDADSTLEFTFSDTRALTFIYRWQGAERFVSAHKLRTNPSADYESFTDGHDTYFVYANSKSHGSEVFKAKVV